jgi:acyl-coenzyme A synthetase/AMP-(fatty) acid ligase
MATKFDTIFRRSKNKTMPNSNSLIDILHAAPAERTAVILPEAGIRVTYQGLRDQVMTMAEDLTGLGVSRGDRVAQSRIQVGRIQLLH